MCEEVQLPSCSKEILKDSPRKKKLKNQNIILKRKIKALRENIRRLTKEKKKKKEDKKKASEYELLRTLGNNLLPQKFARLLSVQIDAQTKGKQGARYSSEFKKYALSLYFLSPRNYRELKKSMQLPSIRSLQLFT